MMNTLFSGIFDTSTTSVISVSSFLLCVAVSLAVGLFISAAFGYKSKSSQSFLVTLALLPAVVCVVIMMVNGNVGAGVAVAGAFSLVRFRSAPGTAREIGAIFLAMASGLLTGMGYLGYAVLFAVIIGLVNFLYESIGWKKSEIQTGKTLHITIPENLDYTNVFDEIFAEFTKNCEMVNVKTTNMGSLFKLTYQVELKENVSEKDFIDKLRCRNGNLEIVMARKENNAVGEL
ncbi:MAG: DUF4956 domain-containing protein [Lachnospiraceae bacterium]|nr:DUF4956 domain-containing protein [Lachnospiraceae bacterium]MBQ8116568.1 DUF4956 domain-containing protein [Lachnospiraceae bacterium]